ncbi:hypothetical protein EON82_08840 [bacterium]|nr:MAG: hypothetical protein EON82_08840 [bacterium]
MTPLNAAIELHDTTLGSIQELPDGSLVVRFAPAYVHRSAGTPGVDDGIGEVQNCSLIVATGQIEGEIGKLPTAVLDGELHIGEVNFGNMIDLTCKVEDEPVALTLFLAQDFREIRVSGRGLVIRLEGDPKYVEEFGSARVQGGSAPQ